MLNKLKMLNVSPKKSPMRIFKRETQQNDLSLHEFSFTSSLDVYTEHMLGHIGVCGLGYICFGRSSSW